MKDNKEALKALEEIKRKNYHTSHIVDNTKQYNIIKQSLTPKPITADEIVAKYFDNYLGYDWPSTNIKFVKIFYKDNKFYITDDWVNTQEVTTEWVNITCELFFMEVE